MSNTIKQNLFRFVTLRNPQLIDEKENHKGFIFHPDEKQSVFFTAINGKKEDEVGSALKEISLNFDALKTRKEVKSINENLYAFSFWLMRNKNHLTYAEIKSNIEEVNSLDIERKDDILLWDNLIFQTVTQQSVYVREALIQLLIANQFLNAFLKFSEGLQEEIIFTEGQEKEFARRANASVVLSKSLFVGLETTESNESKKIASSALKQIGDIRDVSIAKFEKRQFENLIEELKQIEIKYNKDSQKAYDFALENHNKDVERLIEEAVPVITEETDPETGKTTTVTTYPDLKFPKFEFTKEEAITEDYLISKLTDQSISIFNDENLFVYDSFEEVYQDLKLKIKSSNQIIYSKSKKTSKTVSLGGVNFKVESSSLPSSPYCFLVRQSSVLNKDTVYMYLSTPSQIDIIEANYTLTLNSNTSITYSKDSVLRVHGGGASTHQGLILFEEGLLLVQGVYTLTGQFKLSNGIELDFNVDNFIIGREKIAVQGCANVTSGTTVDTDTNRFGVTNLGIADFRRVEQEVCCYVPGEVSHIENVMAREYKERSTRNLISSENTTEQTEERERENLTDTTTTERNEMQSEVASVINEDKSKAYGANAFLNGKLPGDISYGVSGYADFSSSSSTSNSNNQALTYAQEVTERAMERIVTKTQTKRTSRILKEFEENNKHGFDNTKGASHVTGVYRWVDKIYKNKLINYGKRLMYEFAIPEPAKFLKDALWKKIENNQNIESAILLPEQPIHPSMLLEGISNASELTEDNYQAIASQYNAEVEEIPSEIIKVGKEFYEKFTDQGVDSNLRNGKSFDIEIPEGYQSNRVLIKGSFMHEGGANSSTLIITAGNKVQGYGNNYSFNAITFDHYVDKIEGNFPVSFTTQDIEPLSLNAVLECERKESYLQKWQNQTYNAILDAYNDRLREYNEVMQANELGNANDEYKLTFNPAHNRSLEKKELKRIAIELLIDQTKVSKDNYNNSTVAKVNKNEAFKNHASTVKFFEQAFDWEIMSYIFYPYFYADENDWKSLFQEQDAADPLFQAFLQSGMARTVVPVRPGFEDAVNWYMTTGEIWNGQGLVVDQDDDLYVSIAEEMQTIEGEVEGTWETRLPTNLTVIQAGSIGLNVQGLPCNSDCETSGLFDSDQNPIVQTDTLIGGTEEGVRHIENVDIVDGYLKLNTDDNPRQTVAQISVKAIKNAIDEIA